MISSRICYVFNKPTNMYVSIIDIFFYTHFARINTRNKTENLGNIDNSMISLFLVASRCDDYIGESRHAPNPTMGLDFQKLLKVLPSSN